MVVDDIVRGTAVKLAPPPFLASHSHLDGFSNEFPPPNREHGLRLYRVCALCHVSLTSYFSFMSKGCWWGESTRQQDLPKRVT